MWYGRAVDGGRWGASAAAGCVECYPDCCGISQLCAHACAARGYGWTGWNDQGIARGCGVPDGSGGSVAKKHSLRNEARPRWWIGGERCELSYRWSGAAAMSRYTSAPSGVGLAVVKSSLWGRVETHWLQFGLELEVLRLVCACTCLGAEDGACSVAG